LKSDTPPPILNRKYLFALAFFSTLVFLIYQGARLLAPFFSAFLWAAVISLALHPAYKRLTQALHGRTGLSAGVMTAATVLLVVGPAVAMLSVLAAQAVGLYQWTSELVQSGKLADAWGRFAGPVLEKVLAFPFFADVDVKGLIINGLREFSSGMASQIGGILKNLFLLVINLLIMLVTLFFFFRNGESYYRLVTDLLPFTHDQKQTIARKFRDTFTAVINGVFLIALLQGLMTGIGFALFGVPFFVFWGALAAVFALFPIGGAALVWIPGALYLYLQNSTLSAIFLAVWGTLLVSLPDNFLKPLIIGRKTDIPAFFLFIAILGGLQVYGVLGILFGPLIVTLLTAFIQIYREEYSDN
jgi:predicted PurR-regulated permease PerM